MGSLGGLFLPEIFSFSCWSISIIFWMASSLLDCSCPSIWSYVSIGLGFASYACASDRWFSKSSARSFFEPSVMSFTLSTTSVILSEPTLLAALLLTSCSLFTSLSLSELGLELDLPAAEPAFGNRGV